MFKARTLIPLSVLLFAFVMVLNVSGVSLPGFGGSNTNTGPSDLVIGRTFKIDDAFEARAGTPVPLRLQLVVPKRPTDTHTVGVEEMPTGGLVQFNFRAPDGGLMESLFIAPIKIPNEDESGAPASMEDRLAVVGEQLEAQAPALMSQTHQDVTASPAREITLGGLRAMELTGTYRDPADGLAYYYRFVSLPHPDMEQSLYAVSHINQAFATIQRPDDHAQTLSGKALSTLRLTDSAAGN
ncbi:hypothetical protein IV417_08275 [Alphaproteobacteria bacterium KMM 3653]|uniref:Uncharacterized protein n=1 Tax=Harenicola maris TaxID=2841044 RepID=A0AAP2CMZ2_9RHOB|nr:hypothetical protein [Harenicola maris]